MLLPSIMGKKKAIGATHVAIDIPAGRSAKTETIGEAYTLAYDFIDSSKNSAWKNLHARAVKLRPLFKTDCPSTVIPL